MPKCGHYTEILFIHLSVDNRRYIRRLGGLDGLESIACENLSGKGLSFLMVTDAVALGAALLIRLVMLCILRVLRHIVGADDKRHPPTLSIDERHALFRAWHRKIAPDSVLEV